MIKMNLQGLVNTGKAILNGIKYVPAEPGIIRTFSVYKLEDGMTYSTWKNQSILYLQNVLCDQRSLNRFEEEASRFEKQYYKPEFIENMIGVLEAYLEEELKPAKDDKVNKADTVKNKVFVVHGHNEAVNQEVARTIEKLGLEAIILREQPNSGQTIIEKFENQARDVGFAIILLTADDKIEGEAGFRARQNVVFEMGYFMGALGRDHVVCLVQNMVETPGDIAGVVYTVIDTAGVWKYSMVKELKACGYNVDANRLL